MLLRFCLLMLEWMYSFVSRQVEPVERHRLLRKISKLRKEIQAYQQGDN